MRSFCNATAEICQQLVPTDEKSFRFLLNEDAMATEKTSEGIRLFVADINKLEKLIADKLAGTDSKPKEQASSRSGA